MTDRQTGRTTKMLQEAAEAQERGRVLILAPSQPVAEFLCRRARDLGLSFHRAEFRSAQEVLQGRCRGFRGEIFEDHTVREMLSEQDQFVLKAEILAVVGAEDEERLRLREELRQIQGATA
jgi:hypothetical protein